MLEDDIPDLGDDKSQLDALLAIRRQAQLDVSVPEASIPVASFTPCKTNSAKNAAFRRGFLRSTEGKLPRSGESEQSLASRLHIVGSGKPSKKAGPSIPEYLKLPLTEEEQRFGMTSAIMRETKPDAETLQSILQNPSLLAGFDDPEVMAAVSEVSQNPQAFQKYSNNAKVLAFYRQLGSLLDPKLEKAKESMRRPKISC